MSGATAFQAVISELDGVITRPAQIHQRAWKHLFDEFFAERRRTGSQQDKPADEDLSPFTPADYRQHVYGKPRDRAIRDVLTSRGISLPEGAAGDGPDTPTINGLCGAEKRTFLQLLASEGVRAFADARAVLGRWKRGQLPLAVISTSGNARAVLAAAGLEGRVAAVLDGDVATAQRFSGKPALIAEAARRLGVRLARSVLLTATVGGVQDGRQVGCGLVVGVDRDGQPGKLAEAGAHHVVADLTRLRFPRRLPDALTHRAQLATFRDQRPLAVFLDFDGTLSPIVNDPKAARISASMRQAMAHLAERATIAIVSGRDRLDVRKRTGLLGLFYAGSHGLEIAGPGRHHVHPEAQAAVPEIEAAQERLQRSLADIPGVVLERKPFSIAVHYRMVADDQVERVKQAAADTLASSTRLRLRTGKKVHELLPDIDWDKGHAVAWLLETFRLDPFRALVLYIGDDETDEDAFRVISGQGLGIHVGGSVSDSLADFRLADPAAVEQFLRWLAGGGFRPRPSP